MSILLGTSLGYKQTTEQTLNKKGDFILNFLQNQNYLNRKVLFRSQNINKRHQVDFEPFHQRYSKATKKNPRLQVISFR